MGFPMGLSSCVPWPPMWFYGGLVGLHGAPMGLPLGPMDLPWTPIDQETDAIKYFK